MTKRRAPTGADAGPKEGVALDALPGVTSGALPDHVPLQLAALAEAAPAGDNWLHEIKHDGYRILARIADGRVRLYTRNRKEWSHRFPEIAAALAALPLKQALLDGEIVAVGEGGVSSFRDLQEALTSGHTGKLVYYVFDLLHLEGRSLTATPQALRKQALADLFETSIDDSLLRFSEHIRGRGPAFSDNACRLGLEGIIAKRADAPYRGGRGDHWLKIKCTRHQEFVVGGYTQPRGRRNGFGALLLGAWDDGEFVYAGKVGTGFSERLLRQMHGRLQALESRRRPFREPVPEESRATWVKPELVVEVEFAERTRDGLLRQPRFRGLREDRVAQEIVVDPATSERIATEETAAEEIDMRTEREQTRGKSGGKAGGSSARASAVSKGDGEAHVAGVRLSNPGRVMYPRQGVTKLDLARYYDEIEQWVIPRIRRRPLTLVRCPEGREEECFYQKHPYKSLARDVPRVAIAEKSGKGDYLYVEEIADLVALVQWGTLELHTWGCTIDDLEHPDVMVFDLDPGPGVPWSTMVDTARSLRKRVDDLGLTSFLRTTGGKGLHLVVPVTPSANWDQVKAFTHAVSQRHAEATPDLLTTNMSKAKRKGRIFIDYLRNGRGSTAIANYSARARPHAPVAVPVRWSELGARMAPDKYRVDNLARRLGAIKGDPWEDFENSRRPLRKKMFEALGLDGAGLDGKGLDGKGLKGGDLDD